ncbi:HD domain-containing protein [Nioella nitratireducens]|uniref:HD domain-containing protein n=1 Tax=Nioella nitratireducens TaxID=1287720 RepID=UPI0008FD1F49|nr:HD domain-containing protein [Nioella nitratireducens]
MSARLDAQLAFLLEADRLKQITRASYLADRSRHENSAEHSWHLTLFALVLADQAPEGVQIDRVIRMLILHDIVEIDAGDAPIHGAVDTEAMAAREQAAADRLFGLLPGDQTVEFRALWEEFEAAESPDAIFAKSLDRFQPPVLNLHSEGGSWPDYDVTEEQVRSRVGPKIARGAPGLWDWLSPKLTAWFGKE